MPEEIRTFVAIELGEAQRRALRSVQSRLQDERAARYVRWVAPESIHLTLKFLGGVDAGRMPALQSAIENACAGIAPHVLSLGGAGAFPNTRRPHVIWVGIGGEVQVTARLAEQIEHACTALGFPPEERPFSPHLTLGRVKRDAHPSDQKSVGEMVENYRTGDLGQFRVEQVFIMKSDLRPTGSVYTQLAVVKLHA